MEKVESTRYTDIVCIGGGLSSLALGARLELTYNHTSIHYYDRHTSLGGTWAINTYPGAACDVPSALYSFSFAQNPGWTTMMPSQAEIKVYLDSVAEKYGITSRVSLQTEAVKAEWIEATNRWRVCLKDLRTGKEYAHECKILFSATGQLVVPNIPAIPGMEAFEGKVFHSARWDHGVSLAGKRVAVVGNGCTAAQIVPGIMEQAAEVYQVIRSKHWVQKAPEFPYTPTLLWMFKNIPGVLLLHRFTIFLAAEWDVRLQWMNPVSNWQRKRKMRTVEAYMRKTAPEKFHNQLVPSYEIACKRRIMDTGYLTSLHSPKAHLVTSPRISLTPTSLITTTSFEIPIDILILATGFVTNRFLAPMRLVGRGGQTLEQHFETLGGPGAYNTAAVNGFPNFFIILGPNTATGHTSALMASENIINYCLKVSAPVLRGDATRVEIKESAEREYVQRIQKALMNTVWNSGCFSWYTTPGGWNAANYPWSQPHFLWRCLWVRWQDWNVEYIRPPRKNCDVALWAAGLGLGLLALLAVSVL